MMEKVVYHTLELTYNETLNTMDDDEPYLYMEIEPETKYRFRYESEGGSHGGLSGKERKKGKKTFPTVKLMDYNGSSQDVFIRVSLCTENKMDHVLEFKKKKSSGNRSYVDEDLNDDYCAVFKDLTILSKKKEDVYQALMHRKIRSLGKNLSKSAKEKFEKENSEDIKKEAKEILNSVVLRFDALERTKSRGHCPVQICPSLYSDPICNQKTSSKGELKICRMSKVSGSWKGEEEVILLCEKVQKDNIKIKFFENDGNDNKWVAYAKFSPADVHYQVAIPFKTPKYKANVEKTVAVCLERGDEISDLRYFTYLPEDCPVKKRKKCMPEETVNLISSAMDISSPSSSSAALSDDNSLGTSQLMQSFQEICQSTENTPNFSNSSSVQDLENPSSVLDDDLYSQFQLNSFSDMLNFVLPENEEEALSYEEALRDSKHEDQVVNQSLDSNKSLDSYFDGLFPSIGNDIQMDVGKIEGQMTLMSIDDSESAFHISRLKSKQEMKKYMHLISRRDNNGNTLLHLAVLHDKNIGIIMRMNTMSSFDIVNLKNYNQQTALHIAVEKNADVVKDLLLNFANPYIKNADGNNCYHIACQHNFDKCLKYLFRYGRVTAKKISEFNYEGLTPLHIAMKNSSAACLDILMHRYEIDFNVIEQKCGRSVLHYAVEFSPKHVLPLLQMEKTDINCQDFEGNTPLHIACGKKNYDVVKLLLDAGADRGMKNFKQNPLNSDSDEEGSGDEATSIGQTPADLLPKDSKILDLLKAPEIQFSFEDSGSSRKFEDLEKSLSNLLDPDMRWKHLATYVLDEKYFNSLDCSPSPTRAILEYMKRNSGEGYIEELKAVLELVGFNDAVKLIAEMCKPL